MQTTAFVAVIVASSYTANLATFLTASRNAALASKLTSIHDAQAAASKICVGSLSTAPSVLTTSYNRIQQVKVHQALSLSELLHCDDIVTVHPAAPL